MTTARRPRRPPYVEHVMGMPISLALRGRHTDDARGRGAWAAALAVLRDVDRVFSTYRADSAISRLGRGEIALADCPPEVAEVLALGEAAERESGGAFDVPPAAAASSTRAGVVKGWAVERAAAAARGAARHRLLPLRRRRHGLPHRSARPTGPGGSVSRTRTTRAGWSPSSRCAPAPSPRPAPPTAAPTSSTPAPAGAPTGVASVTVIGAPSPGRHRRHRGVRPRPGRRRLAAYPPPLRARGARRRHDHRPRRLGRSLIVPSGTPSLPPRH